MPDRAIKRQAHRIAGGVQGLRADHDAVEREAILFGIPAAELNSTEETEEQRRVNATTQRDAVFTIGREGEILLAKCAARTDLSRHLTLRRRPQANFAVALQGVGLEVDTPHEEEVAIKIADAVVVAVIGEVCVTDTLAFGRQQLDKREVARRIISHVGVWHRHTHLTPSITRLRGLRADVEAVESTCHRGWSDGHRFHERDRRHACGDRIASPVTGQTVLVRHPRGCERSLLLVIRSPLRREGDELGIDCRIADTDAYAIARERSN